MNTEYPSKQRKPKMVGKLLTKVLFKLPNRTKRLIFVSSFLAHIQNCNSTDKAIISKLNTLLHLSSDDKALVWPMQLHEKIWGDIKIEKILHDKGIEISDIDKIAHVQFMSRKVRLLSEDIVKAMPEWLKYDSNTRMRGDIMKLFNNLGDILQPAAA